MSAYPESSRRSERAAGLGAVVGLHVLALAALASYAPVREAIRQVIPVQMRFVEPERPKPPEVVKPPPAPPKPPPREVRVAPTPVPPPPAVAPPPPLVTAAPAPAEERPAMVVPPQPPAPPAPAPVEARVESAAPPAPPPAAIAPAAPPAPPAAAPPRQLGVDEVRYARAPQPVYPSAARRLGESGEVRMNVLVNAQGRAERIVIQRSSGSPRLDNAARDAVQDALFEPYREDGRPQPVWAGVLIRFALNE